MMRPKMKVRRSKKIQYVGWASTSLIWFLNSIGKDTSKEMDQYEVSKIVKQYVRENKLYDPNKKKRVICDDRLHFLFGKKQISWTNIYDLLERHLAENREESFDDDDEGGDDVLPSGSNSEGGDHGAKLKAPQSSKMMDSEQPKSCFAAIIPSNIKLVYLRRSFVEEVLLKDPENFEANVVGCFIRVWCDPHDYLQKNSHQLLHVTGIKKNCGTNSSNEEILLQASGSIKHIRIHTLSDENFSEEECDDLRQRVQDGLVKRPMIVDLEKKARALHEDMTKHWIARELFLLQNRIDRANEKGWRRELDEKNLRKKEKLQKPEEQARLMQETPKVVADVQEA